MSTVNNYGKNGKPLQHTRMNWIMERIKNGETLSITELSHEWGVSAKTVGRDFDRLISNNKAIERAEDGKKYRKKQNIQTVNDAQLIIEMIDSMARDVGGEFYMKTHPMLERLQQFMTTPIYSRVDIEDISSKFEMMRQLESAIKSQKKVSFTYQKWYTEEVKKYINVSPVKLMLFDGFWYLLTEHEGHYKKFYLKEISECQVQKEDFKISRELNDRIENALNIWFDPQKEPFEVTLWLDTDAVVYFERKPIAKNQRLYKKPDGTAELIVRITNEEEIFPVLKSWLPNIRILEPDDRQLQKAFDEMLEKYLESY